jgi:hypothetical protein
LQMATRDPQQQQLVVPPVVDWRDDTDGAIPVKGVMPTKIYVYEHHGHLFCIHFYTTQDKTIPSAHRRTFAALARYGLPVDAPGSIEMVGHWRTGPEGRETVTWDHLGEHQPEATTRAAFRDRLRWWWGTR